MIFKRLITITSVALLTFSSLSVYAAEAPKTQVTKYENEVYHIGLDIPEDTYILISKDNTKPSFYGIYLNLKGYNSQFSISDIVTNPQEFYLPNIFYDYEKNSYINNHNKQNDLIKQDYFDNSFVLDLTDEDSNARKDLLYLENCYAVSLKDIDNAGIDICNYGFAPVNGNLSNKEYKITLSKERGGTIIFYKYNKNQKTLEEISYVTLTNKKVDYNIKNLYYSTTYVTIPKNTDFIFKSGINICETSGNVIYNDNDISHTNNFLEKYNFSDVSKTLRTRVMQDFQALSKEQKVIRDAKVPTTYIKTGAEASLDRKKIYKALSSLPKNDAEKEYIRYVREMYVLYSQNDYIDSVLSKYLYNASSFKDIDYAAREVTHNSAANYGIVMNSNHICWY